MKNLLTLLFGLTSAMVFAIGNYGVNDELYVHAPSGLKLRSTPDGETVLATVPFGAKLKVLEARKTVSPKTVDGLAGYWAKVTFGGKTGYLFDGYLSYLPTPVLGCTSLYQYCKTNFKALTDSLPRSLSCDDEVINEDAIQVFAFGTRKVVYSSNQGYEWGGESVTIKGLSAEEGWLLAKNLYKDDFDKSFKYYTEHPAEKDSVDVSIYTTYKLVNPVGPKCIEIPFQSECEDGLEIVERKGILYINRSGGC